MKIVINGTNGRIVDAVFVLTNQFLSVGRLSTIVNGLYGAVMVGLVTQWGDSFQTYGSNCGCFISPIDKRQ